MIPGLVASGAVIATGGPPRDPTAYAAVVLADSPVRYFKLDNTGTENPTDSSLNNAPGSLSGSYVWGVSGAVSTALRFDGTSVRFTITGSGTGSQTRIAWVKTTSTDSTKGYDGNAALTIFGNSTENVWDSFGVHGGKARYTRFNNTVWQTFDSATSVNDGNWHLIAVTYNSSTRAVKIYVDGVEDGSGTMTAHQAQGSVNVIGRGYNSIDYYSGDLDEVEIHNTDLSAARILARWTA